MSILSEICHHGLCFWAHLDETHFLPIPAPLGFNKPGLMDLREMPFFAGPRYLLSKLALHLRTKLARKRKVTFTHWRLLSFATSCLPMWLRPFWHGQRAPPLTVTKSTCILQAHDKWMGRKIQSGLGVSETIQASSTLETMFFGVLPPLVQKGNHWHVMVSLAFFVFRADSPPPPEAAIWSVSLDKYFSFSSSRAHVSTHIWSRGHSSILHWLWFGKTK